MPKIFCLPVGGSTKSKKTSSPRVSDSTQNHNHANYQQNDDHLDATSSLLKYVASEFHALAEDELTVMLDELVLFEYEDPTKEWSHVRSIGTSKSGYVPSKILSKFRQVQTAGRKKMPRNKARLESSHHHHSHNHLSGQHHHHHHHHVVSAGPAASSNGDNSRLSDHQLSCGAHQHLSSIPNSFQGSNSNHTFSKFHDITMVADSPPATYYNLRAPPNHCESYDHLDYKPFIRENFGRLVVINNFVAREENDLEVSVGDIVRVLNKDDEDWYWVRRECDNEEGFVPAKFIKDLPFESFLTKGNSTLSMKSSNLNAAVPTYSNQMETLMPEPPLPSSINPMI